MVRETFHCPRLLQAPSNPSLNTSKDGAASLDNLFKCLISVKFCADLFLPDQEGADMPKGCNFRGPAPTLGAMVMWAMTGGESHTGHAAPWQTWKRTASLKNTGFMSIYPSWGSSPLFPIRFDGGLIQSQVSVFCPLTAAYGVTRVL